MMLVDKWQGHDDALLRDLPDDEPESPPISFDQWHAKRIEDELRAFGDE